MRSSYSLELTKERRELTPRRSCPRSQSWADDVESQGTFYTPKPKRVPTGACRHPTPASRTSPTSAADATALVRDSNPADFPPRTEVTDKDGVTTIVEYKLDDEGKKTKVRAHPPTFARARGGAEGSRECKY